MQVDLGIGVSGIDSRNNKRLSASRLSGIDKTPKGNTTTEGLDHAVDVMNNVSAIFRRRMRYEINRTLNRVVVKVIDGDTGDLIKEIPPVDLQRIYIRMREAVDRLLGIG